MPTPITTLKKLHLETITRLTHIHTHLTATHRNLQHNQPGYPTNTTGTHNTPQLNDDGTPPGLERFLNHPPDTPTPQHLEQLIHQIHQLTLQLHTLTQTWNDNTPKPQPARTPTGGDCIACTRYCTGSHNDRLRAGLCDACRKHRQRHPHLERGDWLLTRKKELTQPT